MNRIEHLGWLLNDLVFDLITPPQVMRDFLVHDRVVPGSGYFYGIFRMNKIATILALTKLHDVFRDYGKEIHQFPDDIRSQVKSFRAFATEKELVRIRNKFIAHNFDDFDNSSYQEGAVLMDAVFGPDVGTHMEFFEWVSPEAAEEPFEKYHPAYLATRMRDHVKTLTDMSPRISALNAG